MKYLTKSRGGHIIYHSLLFSSLRSATHISHKVNLHTVMTQSNCKEGNKGGDADIHAIRANRVNVSPMLAGKAYAPVPPMAIQ